MITVIKLGGNVTSDPVALGRIQACWDQLEPGHRLVLVHGAGTQIDAELTARNIPVVKVDGLRVTTPEIARVVREVMDRVGAQLTAALREAGVAAIHVPATERRLSATPKAQGSGTMDRVGTATGFDAPGVLARIPPGRAMVVTPVGWDTAGPLNVNADEGAVAVAAAMHAARLLLVTDVPGVMDANGVVHHRIDARTAHEFMASGVAKGGMIPKLQNALDALERGTHEVIIGGLGALESDETGTRIVAEAP